MSQIDYFNGLNECQYQENAPTDKTCGEVNNSSDPLAVNQSADITKDVVLDNERFKNEIGSLIASDLNSSKKNDDQKPDDQIISGYIDEFKQYLELKKSLPKENIGAVLAPMGVKMQPTLQEPNQSKYGFHFDDGETDNSSNSYHNSPQSPSLNSTQGQSQRRMSPPMSSSSTLFQGGNTQQQHFQMPPPQQPLQNRHQDLLYPEQQYFQQKQNQFQEQSFGARQGGMSEDLQYQLYQQKLLSQMSSAQSSFNQAVNQQQMPRQQQYGQQYNQYGQRQQMGFNSKPQLQQPFNYQQQMQMQSPFPHHPNGLHANQFHQQQAQLRTGPLGAMQAGKVKATPIKKDTILYQIQFKMEFRYYVPSPFMTDEVGLNDFVVVETEKGEDLGIVVDFVTFADFTAKKNKEKQNSDSEDGRIIRRMKRLATEFDLALLPEKFHDESVVIEHSNEMVQNVLCIPLQILGAEYSFDRKKLYVYYQTDSRRVDFKELISKLFSIFKTCIWLRKHDQNVFNFQASCLPHAVLALRTGILILPPNYQQQQMKVSPTSMHQVYQEQQPQQQYQQHMSAQFNKPLQATQKPFFPKQPQFEQNYFQQALQQQLSDPSYFGEFETSTQRSVSPDLSLGASLGVVHTAAGGIETYRARADSEEDIRY